MRLSKTRISSSEESSFIFITQNERDCALLNQQMHLILKVCQDVWGAPALQAQRDVLFPFCDHLRSISDPWLRSLNL